MYIINTTFGNVEKLYTMLARESCADKTEITVDGTTYTGFMFGTDEMFECDDFYQLFVTEDLHLYQVYFDTTDEEGNFIDLDCIDYDKPCAIAKCKDFVVSATREIDA